MFYRKSKTSVFLQQQLKQKKGKVIEMDRNHETLKQILTHINLIH